MQKLIILDYRNGIVVTLPIPAIKNVEDQVADWCGNNQTTPDDCNWMVWNGTIRYEE